MFFMKDDLVDRRPASGGPPPFASPLGRLGHLRDPSVHLTQGSRGVACANMQSPTLLGVRSKVHSAFGADLRGIFAINESKRLSADHRACTCVSVGSLFQDEQRESSERSEDDFVDRRPASGGPPPFASPLGRLGHICCTDVHWTSVLRRYPHGVRFP